MNSQRRPSVVCIGAGPAGLTAAYQLTKSGIPTTVLEADPVYVGGISKTVSYKGFLFDIGGHRFFSKSQEVEALWSEILGDDFLDRPRKSRIYYRRQLFAYPLKPFDALSKLGVLEAALCVLSYLKARIFPIKHPKNFEEWVTNKFGKRLFNIFFKTYTEKVWGMSCKEISADWAAQRIKGLSLATAILHMMLPKKKVKDRGEVIKTLIDSFRYPRRGPGMMWERAVAHIRNQGGSVLMGREVTKVEYGPEQKKWTLLTRSPDGVVEEFSADHVICSMPIRELADKLVPQMSGQARNAAEHLNYRDFLVVTLIVKDRNLFDDNWIYIHEPGLKVGRIQNFKSWSPEMIPDPELNCYGMEYFCFEGDSLWDSADADLIALGKSELVRLNLARPEDILDGYVVRQKKAYPVYDEGYADRVDIIRREVDDHYPALSLVGRNGMHKYNNQDHAMMTAAITARNIVAGRQVQDPWCVNQDAEYHEAGEAGSQAEISERLTPVRSAQ
ncbi:MAG TPA: NAD(P)/FAD-dependent oxidoreductase [Rhizomicrobium sp.]|nr:NAD(P)/FAD-dependent oxidoreductase [Rhizomicrobium sp.]